MSERVVSLPSHLRVGERILTVVCVYGPKISSAYPPFLESLEGVLKSAAPGDSLVLLGDFNAHFGSDSVTWRGLVGKNGHPDLKPSGVLFPDLSAHHGLSITNTMFRHKGGHVHLAPGHPRPQFDDRLCSCVVRFAAACPGHSGEERGGGFNRPPPGGELAQAAGVEYGETGQTYHEGLLGALGGVPHQKELQCPPRGELHPCPGGGGGH